MAYEMNGYGRANVYGDQPEVKEAFISSNNAEERKILAAMDRLRELGIDREYDLPQIIVCGSQSAGKSSVLESIVQVPFPRSDNTCTRYVTKVTILPAQKTAVEVGIHPSEDRPSNEKKVLLDFLQKDESPEYASRLDVFMAEAHKLIFTGSRENAMITKDVLLVTVYAPGNRPLQVLDLPGLIAYDQKELGNEKVIEEMVTRYMAMKQSIILAVIKANEDLNNQKVLKLCKDHDADGLRTLGVITRPDMADESQKRNMVALMAGKSEGFQFNHKWHVVRNRSSDELSRNTSQEHRDETERRVLSEQPWHQVREENKGIRELRNRLGEMLFTVAKRELPSLCNAFRDKLTMLKTEFEILGGDEYNEGELERIFERASIRLRKLAHDHARGIYESDVSDSKYGTSVFLRSRVVEQSEVFRDRLFARGHTWKTLVRPSPADPDSDLGSIYKEEDSKSSSSAMSEQNKHSNLKSEVDEVVDMIHKLRGTALPTFNDPRLINHLFWRMSKGWNAISQEHVRKIYQCCEAYFRDVIPVAFSRTSDSAGPGGFSNAKKVADRFIGPHIIPRLEESRASALKELEKLEQDRQDFLINTDFRFLKDRRAHSQGRQFERALRAQHEVEQSSGSTAHKNSRLDQTTYSKHLGLHSQFELAQDDAEKYLDAMWSHYLIDRDMYIMNVLRQVIERHFLRHLEEIIPERLKLEIIKELVQKDTSEERRKQEIKDEMKVLESSLKALEGIR